MATKPKAAMPAAPAEATPAEATSVEAPRAAATPAEAIEAAAAGVTDDAEKFETPAAALDAGPASIKQGMEKAMKTTEELVAFSQGNVEALVKSSQIWSAGIQDLSKQVAATAQANFDESMNVFKAMTGAKSLKDALDLQAGFARSAFEKSMAESGKLTDASFKLTEQAIAPITPRVTMAIEKMVKAA